MYQNKIGNMNFQATNINYKNTANILKNNFNTPVKDVIIKTQDSSDLKDNEKKNIILLINKFNVSATSYYPRKQTIG
jgi:hypothetical protein